MLDSICALPRGIWVVWCCFAVYPHEDRQIHASHPISPFRGCWFSFHTRMTQLLQDNFSEFTLLELVAKFCAGIGSFG